MSRSLDVHSSESHCWAANLQRDGIDVIHILETVKALEVSKISDEFDSLGIADSLNRISHVEELPYVIHISDLPNAKVTNDLLNEIQSVFSEVLKNVRRENKEEIDRSALESNENFQLKTSVEEPLGDELNNFINEEFWGCQLFRFAETNRLRGDGKTSVYFVFRVSNIESGSMFFV